jgi:hypothetical protein
MFPRVSVFSASVFSASVFSASASASASAVKKSEELGYPGHLSLWKKKRKKYTLRFLENSLN